MDAIERLEVAVLRTLMVEQHVRKYGPFGYRDAKSFRPKFAGDAHRRMVNDIDHETSRNREPFVPHFLAKYSSEPGLPLWMAAASRAKISAAAKARWAKIKAAKKS